MPNYFPPIRDLARYEIWCNRQALRAAEKLAPAQLFDPFPFGLRTIHATLFHTIEVLQTWSGCIAPIIHKPEMVPYNPELSLSDLAKWNEQLSQAFLTNIEASHAENLLDQDRRIHQLFHLVTHGTHHRTQFITMLRLLGIDPPFEAGDFGGWSNL